MTERPEVAQRAKVFCERGNHAFPLSELQAAVLLPQLERLDAMNEQRGKQVHQLRGLLTEWDEYLRPVRLSSGSEPAFYKHAWLAKHENIAKALTRNAQHLGAPLTSGFHGFVKRPKSQARKISPLASAEKAALRTVILHHPVLTQEDPQAIRWIADWISHVMHQVHNKTELSSFDF